MSGFGTERRIYILMADRRFRGQTGKYTLFLSLTSPYPGGHLEAFTRLAYRP